MAGDASTPREACWLTHGSRIKKKILTSAPSAATVFAVIDGSLGVPCVQGEKGTRCAVIGQVRAAPATVSGVVSGAKIATGQGFDPPRSRKKAGKARRDTITREPGDLPSYRVRKAFPGRGASGKIWMRRPFEEGGVMHIMEGYLPAAHAAGWFAASAPFVVAGAVRLKRIVAKRPESTYDACRSRRLYLRFIGSKDAERHRLLFPSHGNGSRRYIFGPAVMALIGTIVLAVPGAFAGPRRLDNAWAQTCFPWPSLAPGSVGAYGVWQARLEPPPPVAVFFAAALRRSGDIRHNLVATGAGLSRSCVGDCRRRAEVRRHLCHHSDSPRDCRRPVDGCGHERTFRARRQAG